LLEACGAVSKIEELQHHLSNGIYEKAAGILENYFVTENEDEEETAAFKFEED